MTDQILGALVLCHRRSDTLDLVLSELLRYGSLPGIKVKIHLLADRPTWQVERVIDKYRPRLWGFAYCPWPIVSSRGERFMEARNLQIAALNKTHCDWYYFGDDDRWLEPNHANTELPSALASNDTDMWYANSVFFQDRADRFNPTRTHHSPLIWRVLPGDRLPLNRTIQATESVHDQAILTGRIATLKTPLLDYGTFSEEERLHLTQTYAKAGKVDAYTAAYTAPAGLGSFPSDAVTAGLLPDPTWRDLYGEVLQDPHRR